MKVRQRVFSGEKDIQAMISLASAFPADNLHVADLPYRLSSWAMDDPGNIGLWVDAEDRLLAWAVMQTPFWTIDYACHPDCGLNLHREILVWADTRARQIRNTQFGHPCWFVMVFTSQESRIHGLEEAGFSSQADVGEDSWSKVLLQRPARVAVVDPVLPQGFYIRPLAGEVEVEAYVHLHRVVFESKSMTDEWRLRTLQRPEYRPDLDLLAVSTDGRLAAFCICWLSEDPPRGRIEPMGVHADFRQLGLGQAILSEGLRRLSRYDVESVYVETDRYRNAALGLYQTLGFHVLQDVLVYRKDFDEVPG